MTTLHHQDTALSRDLLPLSDAERAKACDIGPIKALCLPHGSACGIAFACYIDPDGGCDGYADIRVCDVDEFVFHFGAPVSHARAASLVYDDALRNELAVARDHAWRRWLQDRADDRAETADFNRRAYGGL